MTSTFKDNRFTGRPRSLQQAMSAFFASKPRERNGGIVFTHGESHSNLGLPTTYHQELQEK